jgi:hypothetical protein
MEHELRPREKNCHAGTEFDYYCDCCSLHLRGHSNKLHLPRHTGWTWVLTRDNTGDVVATGGNEHSKGYAGTEDAALNDGLNRFGLEPCHEPSRQDAAAQGVNAA